MAELCITTYTPSQADCLIGLWNACFPTDTPDYIARFMQALPADTVFIVGEMDSSPVTMACLMPAYARFRDSHFAVRYLYAGCTLPQMRGCGYYRQLMEAACDLVKQMGEAAIFLHPADELLEASYRRMGYRTGIAGGTLADVTTRCRVNGETYMHARDAVAQRLSSASVLWDLSPDMVAFFVQDAIGGGAMALCSDDGVCLCTDSDCIEAFSAPPQDHMATYCLWLPTKPSPLGRLMQQYGGFTGLVGD